MSRPDETEAAVRDAYGGLSRLVLTLTDEQSWQASGCAGWAVRDLVFHCLSDAHRALRALGNPAPPLAEPDRDAVTYWQDWRPPDEPAPDELRWTRVSASAWSSFRPLAEMYVEGAAAVVVSAARVPATDLVVTQGHVLSVSDLLSTLAVEATVHHLDISGPLGTTGPGPSALAEVRRVLDGLLGSPEPVGWDDPTYALVGTGRRPLTTGERERLGTAASRFPLFG
jgi:uncharacterized protein (TIGR03083 family)